MEDKSPIIKEESLRIIDSIRERILNDECNEDELLHIIERTNAHANGYYREDDFANYDEAQRTLQMGDRTTMKKFLEKHQVKMHKFKNRPVRFLRCEVEALASVAHRLRRKKK